MIPPTGLGEPTPILNVSTGSENKFETLRDSHIRCQKQGLQEIPVIPKQMDQHQFQVEIGG